MSGHLATRLLLVRHGQSVWNAEGRWQGQADPPLSALGERQARDAVDRLEPVAAVWSSDLARAARTAAIIGDRLGLAVREDARLRERHAGDWEGLTRDEIEARWPGDLASGRRPQGWESDAATVARATEACRDIARANTRRAVLVVTHGGVVRALERAHGASDDGLLANLGGRWFDVVDDELRVGGRVVLLPADEVTTPGQL